MLQRWDLLLREAISDGRAALAAALAETKPLVSANTVSFPLSLAPGLAEHHTAFLSTWVQRTLGENWQIKLVPATAGNERAERLRRYREAEEHPLVRVIEQALDAEVVAREIIERDAWTDWLSGAGG